MDFKKNIKLIFIFLPIIILVLSFVLLIEDASLNDKDIQREEVDSSVLLKENNLLLVDKSEKSSTIEDNDNSFLFKSDKYSFEMFYEKTFVITRNNSNLFSNADVVLTLKGVNPYEYITVVLEKPYGEIDSSLYLDKTRAVILENYKNVQIVDEHQKLVSGKTANVRLLEFDNEEGSSLFQQQIYIEGSNGVYIISFSSLKEDFFENLYKYEKMVETIMIDA